MGFKKGDIPRSVKRSEKNAQISNKGKEGLLAGCKQGIDRFSKRTKVLVNIRDVRQSIYLQIVYYQITTKCFSFLNIKTTTVKSIFTVPILQSQIFVSIICSRFFGIDYALVSLRNKSNCSRSLYNISHTLFLFVTMYSKIVSLHHNIKNKHFRVKTVCWMYDNL